MNREQVDFMIALLEDELGRLNIKRSKSVNIKKFNENFGDRIKYMKDLIIYLKNLDHDGCKYCNGRWSERKSLLYGIKNNHMIKINTCNYLEENKRGGEDDSLYGKMINFCPMCGKKLR